jgi:hypothetical protein
MEQNFTETQKEIVARKLGYEGPMNMFDKFLESNVAAQQKYGKVVTALTPKMRKGGYVKKFATGGTTTSTVSAARQAQIQAAPSKNQMRMAKMMGGRKKTPKMR